AAVRRRSGHGAGWAGHAHRVRQADGLAAHLRSPATDQHPVGPVARAVQGFGEHRHARAGPARNGAARAGTGARARLRDATRRARADGRRPPAVPGDPRRDAEGYRRTRWRRGPAARQAAAGDPGLLRLRGRADPATDRRIRQLGRPVSRPIGGVMADTPAIQTEALVKRYGRGGTPALKGLDLTVAPGEVFGFLGPNGAGKSTMIRILLDLIRPTSGHVRVFGVDPRSSPELRRRIGYLAGDFVANGRQTGRELLTYLADLRGGVPAARIDELASAWDLDLSKRIGS